MTKAALLISGILLFAGVAAAGSLTSLGGSDTPTIDTPSLATSTDVRREDRRADRDEAEDLRGPCDEAEHANDPRCTGVGGAQARDDDGDRRNRGPGGPDDGNSGHRSGNSGPGGGDDD